MSEMFYSCMGFMVGACVGVGLMTIAYRESYDEGYRDAWMELHAANRKKKKEDDHDGSEDSSRPEG